MNQSNLLTSLLEHTKLGVERRHLLHWLSSSSPQKHEAEPAPRTLSPKTLLEGAPNPGLTNQIFSLVGVCVLANLTSSRLVVPHFSPGMINASALPFARLFDLDAFVEAMRGSVSVVVVADHHEGSKLRRASHGGYALGSDRGWFLYKAISLAFPISSDRRHAYFRRIERQVLLALHPSARTRALATQVAAALDLTFDLEREIANKDSTASARRATSRTTDRATSGGGSGGSANVARSRGGGSAFGCIHPRIERDMLRSIRFNRAGAPPPLATYLSSHWATAYPSIRQVGRIFVPISPDLRADDERRLRQSTDWNTSVVRTGRYTRSPHVWRRWKTMFERAMGSTAGRLPSSSATKRASMASHRWIEQSEWPSAAVAVATPHTLAALLDMIICRAAAWFMGWSGSTYARLLGFYQMERRLSHMQSPKVEPRGEVRRRVRQTTARPQDGGSAVAFFVACPPPVRTCHVSVTPLVQDGPHLIPHAFCLDLANLLKRGSTRRALIQDYLRNQSVQCTFEPGLFD